MPLSFGSIAKKAVDFLQKIDPQFKNHFIFVVTRNPFQSTSILSTIGSTLGAPVDLAVNFFYVRSVTFPNSVAFEYDKVNTDAYVKSLKIADNVRLTFMEDEKGTVKRYLKEWEKKVAFPSTDNLLGSGPFGERKGYIFADNQAAAKRTGILLMRRATTKPISKGLGDQIIQATVQSLQGKQNLGLMKPSLTPGNGNEVSFYPRNMFYGLVFKSMEDITVGHAETEHLEYSVDFSVDEVSSPLLI